MNCRSSVQIRQAPGEASDDGYCVPQAEQMNAGMTSPLGPKLVDVAPQIQVAVSLGRRWSVAATAIAPTPSFEEHCEPTVIDLARRDKWRCGG
jgi:hypothetical protein